MPIPYTKPYLTTAQQIQLLTSRGMAIGDTAKAEQFLSKLGYYKLSGYWHPFRRRRLIQSTAVVEDNFSSGVEFRHVVDLYLFDKKLRLIFLDALERIEVALRVEIALLLGVRDPFAHRNTKLLHGHFTAKRNSLTGRTEYADWINKFDNLAEASKEEFMKHFKTKYTGPLPIWMAIELWDFGLLSKFLAGMQVADVSIIANKFGIRRHELLISWIRSMNHIRNICAHNGRLWNRPPADQPKLPLNNEIAELQHLFTDTRAQTRIYAVAATMQFILKQLGNRSRWPARLHAHLSTFPNAPNVNVSHMGFPTGWDSLPLWR